MTRGRRRRGPALFARPVARKGYKRSHSMHLPSFLLGVYVGTFALFVLLVIFL